MPPKAKQNDQKAILHTERADLRTAIRHELKSLGIGEVITPQNGDDCISELIKGPNLPLIIDWDLGGDEVAKVLSAARGHFKIDTRAIFLVAAQVDENIILTGYEYGVTHVHTGEISRLGIKEELRKLFEPDDEVEKAIKDALIRVAEARKRNDWSVATPLLAELADKFPEHALLRTELAENYIHEESWDLAIEVLAPLAEAQPPNLRALHLLARCVVQKGDLALATHYLTKAKLINPHNIDRLIDLGSVLLDQNRVQEARENFEAARSMDGKNKDASIGASKCMLLEGDVNDALVLLKSISGLRELGAIFNTTAILSIHHGNFSKGISLYDSAVKAVGTDTLIQARLYFNKGIGYRRWKKADKALECFERSLALDPSFPKALRQKEIVLKALAHSGKRGVDSTGDSSSADDISELEIAPKPSGPSRFKKVAGDLGAGEFEEEDWEDDSF